MISCWERAAQTTISPPVASCRWYRNGEQFEPDLPLYSNPLSETVTIISLTEATAGYYVCVTELPYGLGSYHAVDISINISIPMLIPTPSPMTLPPSTEAPPTNTGSSDTLVLGLEAREVGITAANMVVVLGLVLCVCVVTMCLSQRHSHRDPEHIPLKEMEETCAEESVDYSNSVEIPFSDIVFQELLHRGTFKTVHRAIVTHAPRGMPGLEVAVKRLRDEHSELGSQKMMAEVHILKSIQDKAGPHPHVVSLVGVTGQRGLPCLLLEFVPHGTVDCFLWSLKKGPVPEWYHRHVRDVIGDSHTTDMWPVTS